MQEAAVSRAKTGDPEAFRELYDAHQPRVFGLLLRLTRDEEAAADLAQETWLRVLRGLSSFEGHSSFGTWIYRIAKNLAFDSIRSGQAQARLDRGMPRRTVDHGPDAGDPLLWGRLQLLMSQLPAAKRRILFLHDVVGHTHSEISEMLGCAPGTSRSQLHRARAQMRLSLQGGQITVN